MRRFVRGALGVVLALAVVGGLGGLARSSEASSGPRVAGSADHGVLQQFAPRSATTWWAIVDSNLHPRTWVVRTVDSGRHWQPVTPPVKQIASASFRGDQTAWVNAEPLHPGAPGAPRTEPVYRTLDGGRSWQRIGRVRTECELDFVDSQHGWCIAIGAAMGSSTVYLYRTSNGGSTWSLVSHTGVAGAGSTPGALPYGCDKTIRFTSRRVGWAAEYCNGGRARLYRTRDGGARWLQLSLPPLPKGAPSAKAGGDISLPAVHGPRLSVSLQLDGTPRVALVIATSTDGGRSWRSRLTPGDPRYGTVDLVDTRYFVLSNGTTLLATKDAGQHWRSLKATRKFVDTLGTPLTPQFISPRVGFAGPNINGGPIWRTHNSGMTWQKITITAGPFTLR
jgi:photosystem II stability/assembly factor-like uncharacterized protein